MKNKWVDVIHKILTHNWVIVSVGCLLGCALIVGSK